MHNDEYGVVHSVRSNTQPDKKGKELKKWREKKTLDLSDVTGTEHSIPWVAYPGLFAGGGLDVMTTLLLRRILPTIDRKAKLKVLDYCSGAGQIAAAVRVKAKKSRVWLLDADACALDAAKRNLSDDVQLILSDGWRALEKSDRAFDMILSNPPVHLGLAVDFVPIREFLAGLARRLRPDGVAYFVTQRYVPVRALTASIKDHALKLTCERTDDAKFAVWKCVASAA